MRKLVILGTILTLVTFTLSGCAVGNAVEKTLNCLSWPHGECKL